MPTRQKVLIVTLGLFIIASLFSITMVAAVIQVTPKNFQTKPAKVQQGNTVNFADQPVSVNSIKELKSMMKFYSKNNMTVSIQLNPGKYKISESIKVPSCITVEGTVFDNTLESTIDGQSECTCFVLEGGSVNNLNIMDGYSNGAGGGVLIKNPEKKLSQSEVSNCIISGCTAFTGGGICVTTTSQCCIDDDVIINCTAAGGGGVYAGCKDPKNSNQLVSNCFITKCKATTAGGGILEYNEGSNSLIGTHAKVTLIGKISDTTETKTYNYSGMQLTDNICSYGIGGGACLIDSQMMGEITIDHNIAHDGGGIFLKSGGINVSNPQTSSLVVITNNSALIAGGGVFAANSLIYGTHITTNNSVANVHGIYYGRNLYYTNIYSYNPTYGPLVDNCTISAGIYLGVRHYNDLKYFGKSIKAHNWIETGAPIILPPNKNKRTSMPYM